MFKTILKILRQIFAKQNKRLPLGMESVSLNIKAERITKALTEGNYKGPINSDIVKIVDESLKPTYTKVVPKKSGDVLDMTGKKIQPDETIVGGKGYKIETEAEKKLELDKLLGPDDEVFGSPMKDWYMK